MTFTFFWPLPLVLIIIGALLLATVWTKLDEMRWPVVALVGMTLLMVWMAGEQYFARSTDMSFSLLAGTLFLLVSHSIWLLNRYRFSFRASDAIVAGCYFVGHFLIVRSLYL
ncbi:putative enzyme yhhN [Yersinia enterocolitica]|nr:putative enzyme yhhN [Yersinia enterocolitica]